MWLGEWSLGQPLAHQQGSGAHRDRLAGHRLGAGEVGQGHVARGQQPRIDRAELDHAAVVGAGGAVGEVEVAAALEPQQVPVVERVEHELARHPEQVEGQWPVRRDGAAGGDEVLALHDLVGIAGTELRVVVLGQRLGDRLRLTRGQAQLDVGPQLVPNIGIGVVHEPGRLLHDVGIGVVHDAPFDVRHPSPCGPAARPRA